MKYTWIILFVGLLLTMGVLLGLFGLYPALAANKSEVLISEVLYDPPGTSGCANPGSEWVELYNNSGSPINIKNWKICDNNYCDTITTSDYTISADDKVVIAVNSTDFSGCGYSCGSGNIIYLGGYIGNGLKDDGDRVYILDDSATPVRVDEMSYGTDTTYLNPAAPDVADGHSLERNPINQDTDSASDWRDQSSPSPCQSPTAITLSSLTAHPVASQPTSFHWQWLALAGGLVLGGAAVARRWLGR